MDRIAYLTEQLNMQPHPEGGYFAETYRSLMMVDTLTGPRPVATSIYFLMTAADFSAFHRIFSDEGWHHYEGDAILVHMISPAGEYSLMALGTDFSKGERPQGIVPAGYWFASEIIGEKGYALVGCTVAPGFDFADFELAKRDDLAAAYPLQAAVIERLTRQ